MKEDLRPLRLGNNQKNYSLRLRRVKKITTKLLLLSLVIGILISLAFFLITLSGSSTYVNYIFSGTSLKSGDGKVNVLLLGIAGGMHDGGNLTDTIMVASYDLRSSQVYLISIPRDLWLPSLQSKANAVYQIGLLQGSGLGLAKTVMGNIVGLPIHYALRIDFRGFVTAVDTLGGIDIVIDKSFDDYNYPIEGKENDLCGYQEQEIDFTREQATKLNIEPGKRKVFIAPDGFIATDSAQEDKGVKYFSCRYERIGFKEGLTHMDGQTALKFVRSRRGTSGEASDFARSKRQTKVLEATRSKILSFETLTSPSKISQLLKTFGQSIGTDISVKDVPEFYKLSRKITKTHSFVLDDSRRSGLPDGRISLLINPPREDYGGAYVLISQDDDFATIQGYVRKILKGEITEYDATASARTSDK